MDLVAISAALRIPLGPQLCAPECYIPAQRVPDEGSLAGALSRLDRAVERQRRAEAEAATSRRPSTLKATLKSAADVERARAHVRAELRLLAALDTLSVSYDA